MTAPRHTTGDRSGGSPPAAEVIIRSIRSDADYAAMAAVLEAPRVVDGLDLVRTATPATALIGRHLRRLAERGMTEAALSVDTGDPTGALALGERAGFVRDRSSLICQRPV